jgi:plasmid stability protein
MADILVRNIDPNAITRLKEKARRHNRSLQAELKRIVVRAAEEPEILSELELIRQIRESIKNPQTTDSTDLIREDRQR